MSTVGDAISAIKSIILIEERVKSQGEKLEKLAVLLVEIDRRLVRAETTLDLATRHAGTTFTAIAVQPLPSGKDKPDPGPSE